VTVKFDVPAITGVITICAESAPELHEYVDAPDATSVAVCPMHSEPGPVTESVGSGTTVSAKTCCALQPEVLVPTTEYTIDAEAVAVYTDPVALTGDHEYVAAPEALMATVDPAHAIVFPLSVSAGTCSTV
jgi:hypothetical protein